METLQLRPLVVLKKTASSTSLASKDDTTDSARFSRKFGKHIQKRQLEIPEYAASFVDYKALKKVRHISSNFLSSKADSLSCSLSRSLALRQ
jgi:CDK inhibitor PHO81